MGAANALNTGLRQAEVLHLAFGDQILHRSGDIFNWDVGIDTVLVKKVNHIGPQPF